MNERVLFNVRVNYCALRCIAWKERVRAHVIRSKQGRIVRYFQSILYPRTVNSVCILFSWHKNFGGVIKRDSYLAWRKVSHGWDKQRPRTNFLLVSVSGKKCVGDRFISLHCLKCWWKQHTSEDFILLVYSFNLETNTKRKILKLNIFYLVEKIVRFHVDCRQQFSIVYLKSEGCSQWGPCIGINGQ